MQTTDMTRGNPMRLMLGFAVPLLIGNLFQQVYSLMDTMIAGYYLGDGAIAAIGATSSIYNLIIYFASGLNSGYAIIVTQRFGAHDRERFRASVATMLMLNLAGAALLTGAALAALRPMMAFLQIPDEIHAQAYTYIAIICGGMSATLMYNMFASFLRAVGNSKTPLYFLIASSLLNLALDCLLIIVFPMGVAGAALATVIAQGCSAVLCGRYIWRHYRELLPAKRHLAAAWKGSKEMLETGLSMAMMQCIFSIGSVILQRAINGLAQTAIITAHTAARRVVDLLMLPFSTIASASATFIGQNWGAGERKRVQEALRKAIGLAALWGMLAAALVYAFGAGMIVGMTGTSDAEVIANAVMNLRINFAFYPFLGVLVCLRTAMQGMGQKLAPLAASSLELGIKVGFSLWVIPRHGYAVASLTEPLTWLVCMLLLGGIYFATRRRTFARCPTPALAQG